MTLCENCRWKRDIVSGTGSRFLLCTLSQSDPRFKKYPPQPVVKCSGHMEARRVSEGESPGPR
jgi:hypothetical protein